MKNIKRAVLTLATVVGLTIGMAAHANAESVKFNATPGQLQAACNKVGGQYHQSEETDHYYCVTQSGLGGCNPRGQCSYTVSDPAARSNGPTIPQLIAPAGVAN
jgi:hypothetical protein